MLKRAKAAAPKKALKRKKALKPIRRNKELSRVHTRTDSHLKMLYDSGYKCGFAEGLEEGHLLAYKNSLNR